ncbi:probable palmitoyltransferase ZDHHC24 [Drosophila grimshawi]|uniref:Palmitoyltransferase n=1 Tax=Drosophila grimshawi TaxID=7222 RepID=B4J8N7_DROGR|nr:probable palmitoyltransferase ZDHHC24 [Drosophila grimshawi]EDW01304.1 GH20531 [Drosophila grimshawi]
MRVRRNPLPRRLVDILCYLVIGVFLPIVFIFEIIVVLPQFHAPGSLLHSFTFLLAMFMLFNIKGNMVACMMIDTSVDKLVEAPPVGSAERLEWRHCTICDKLAPPRSWHCKVCGVCILKRDHHCLFTGCCIGHENHRYFMCFIFYLFVGSLYALAYNSVFMWVLNGDIYYKWITLVKLLCPMSMLVLGNFWTNLQLFFYCLNILALLYALVMLWYHVPIMLRGEVCAESGKPHKYNNGLLLNLQSVFGQRMHVVWLSPLIKSPLPDDGYTWKISSTEELVPTKKSS